MRRVKSCHSKSQPLPLTHSYLKESESILQFKHFNLIPIKVCKYGCELFFEEFFQKFVYKNNCVILPGPWAIIVPEEFSCKLPPQLSGCFSFKFQVSLPCLSVGQVCSFLPQLFKNADCNYSGKCRTFLGCWKQHLIRSSFWFLSPSEQWVFKVSLNEF